jgi:hypothetical protein
VAELPFEGTAEAGGIREAQILGDRRNGLGGRGVGRERMRFEQTLALNVLSDTSPIFAQAIKTGPGHSNEPA